MDICSSPNWAFLQNFPSKKLLHTPRNNSAREFPVKIITLPLPLQMQSAIGCLI